MRHTKNSSPRPFDRIAKVNNLILSELNAILLKKGLFSQSNEKEDWIVSLSRVETSRDLRSAKIFFLVMPEKCQAKSLKILGKRTAEIQKSLAGKLHTKSKPRIEFIYDDGQSNAFAVEEILRQLEQ